MQYVKPIRMFESAGVVDPQQSYYVRLEHVVSSNNQDMTAMIERGRYFSIFAPRQSGKTSFLKDIFRELTRDLRYIPGMLNFQDYKSLDRTTFYSMVQRELYPQLIQRLEALNVAQLPDVRAFFSQHFLTSNITFRVLFEDLLARIPEKRIVIFIDEFDGIPLEELDGFLSSIRTLYQAYKHLPQKALHAIGLIGIRNMTKLVVGGVSPFNIADQVRLPPFTLHNISDLYAQYTAETNQPFTTEAVQRVFEATNGQPWLVNRLATIATVDIKPETVAPITADDMEQAIAKLLIERNSHFDNLAAKAKLHRETFVAIVFNGVTYNPDDDAQFWLEQFGLIKEADQKAVVSNGIYQQRFLKAFFKDVEASPDASESRYFTDDGFLNMETILADFEEYIMQIGVNAFYERDTPYEKTGQFLLTAWLYQFVQAGQGELRHETPSGVGRMDIYLNYRGRKYIIETKLNRGKLQTTLDNARDQLLHKYIATERVDEGYIVVFDVKTPVGEQIEPQHQLVQDKEIVSIVIGIGKE